MWWWRWGWRTSSRDRMPDRPLARDAAPDRRRDRGGGLTSIPVVGGVAKLLIVLFGLGALAYAWWRSRKKDDDVDWSQVPAEPPSAPTPTAPA